MKAKKLKIKAVTEKFTVLNLNMLKSLKGGAIPACEDEECLRGSPTPPYSNGYCYCPDPGCFGAGDC